MYGLPHCGGGWKYQKRVMSFVNNHLLVSSLKKIDFIRRIKIDNPSSPEGVIRQQIRKSSVKRLKLDVFRIAERLRQNRDFDVFGSKRFTDEVFAINVDVAVDV